MVRTPVTIAREHKPLLCCMTHDSAEADEAKCEASAGKAARINASKVTEVTHQKVESSFVELNNMESHGDISTSEESSEYDGVASSLDVDETRSTSLTDFGAEETRELHNTLKAFLAESESSADSKSMLYAFVAWFLFFSAAYVFKDIFFGFSPAVALFLLFIPKIKFH
ncbi:unnamed protein product [Clavelina lepadiformis]|uniref:Uncharacterized protein n=1 Tax=Clavelina lepadiformis TaxID=159417 RepID=A0ABP0G840_CLALP